MNNFKNNYRNEDPSNAPKHGNDTQTDQKHAKQPSTTHSK